MSRTDKTDPTPVKIAHGQGVEVHDHINNVCELKDDPTHQRTFPSVAHECYLDADWYDPIHRCGCWSCRGSWREQAKREDKTAAKRSLRNWRKEYE